jgi:hypothetical protein
LETLDIARVIRDAEVLQSSGGEVRRRSLAVKVIESRVLKAFLHLRFVLWVPCKGVHPVEPWARIS